MMIRIRGGRVIDPSQRIDSKADLWIKNGIIEGIFDPADTSLGIADQTLECDGAIVAPGFVDLHAHLRDPGQTEKEDLESGTFAAVAGGFTSVLCMPNTKPANDSAETTRYILEKAARVGHCRVYPVGAITKGLQGTHLAPIEELHAAGCVAFSDDGRPVNDPHLMREALIKVKKLGSRLIEHCEELSLSIEPKVHDGEVSKKLHLKGIPRSVETMDAVRTLTLGAETGANVHLAHVSCAQTVELIREFKKTMSHLTAEVTPHHLLLNDSALETFGTNAKMYPPLRESVDQNALIAGLVDGTLDVIATDHAPHTKPEKDLGFEKAPCGVIAFESTLPALLSLVSNGTLTLSKLIDCLSYRPAKVVGLKAGTLQRGMPADVVVFNANEKRTLTEKDFKSKSKNSPFLGFKAYGRVLHTFVGGREVYAG